MSTHTFRPGDHVRFIDDPEDLCGTVRTATADELAYAETWPPAHREGIRGHVMVYLDGDDPEDAGWYDPADLELA